MVENNNTSSINTIPVRWKFRAGTARMWLYVGVLLSLIASGAYAIRIDGI